MGSDNSMADFEQLYNAVAEVIGKSEKILICVNNRASYDTHTSALALLFFLKDLGKNTSLCLNGKLSVRHEDLFKEFDIKYEESLKPMNYVITLDHTDSAIEKVSFDDKDGKFKLFLTPAKDSKAFDFSKVSYSYGGGNFDLIFVFGARSLNWLGDVYKQNMPTFQNTKLVNINDLEGEQEFGDFRLIDPKISVAQLISGIVLKDGAKSSKQIADLLLRGLLDRLQPLQRSEYNVSSVEAIPEFVKAGADLKKAMSDVYFDRDWPNFKVVKRVVNNVKYDPKSGLAWSIVNAFDISQCGVTRSNFLLGNRIVFNLAKMFKIAFVLYEIEGSEVWVEFESNSPELNAVEMLSDFKPIGNAARVTFVISGKSALEAEDELLALLKGKLGVSSFSPIMNGEKLNDEVKEASLANFEPNRRDDGNILTKAHKKSDNQGSQSNGEEDDSLVVPPPITPVDPAS